MSAPHFLCVGAQRSGTTWLHRNLGAHPDIWLPPIKELHYFDEVEAAAGLTGEALARYRRKRLHKRRRLVMRRLAPRRLKRLRRWRPSSLAWHLRFLYGERTDEWYRSLFAPGARRLCGDLTPAYGILQPATVARVHALLPEARILFMMRNPVERAWSHCKKRLRDRGVASADVDTATLLDSVASGSILARSRYVQIVDTWRAHYPEQRLFVGFFEDIQHRPQDLLDEIHTFLGLPAAPPGPRLYRRVNATPDSGIPEDVERALSELLYDELDALRRRYEGPPAQWLQRASRITGRTPDVPDRGLTTAGPVAERPG